MTDPAGAADPLKAEATAFADSLTDRLHRILDTDSALVAEALDDRVVVQVEHDGVFAPIPLRIDGKHRLNLTLKFYCCWDSAAQFLAIEESLIHVIPVGKKTEALFRYEYVRNATQGVPCAHIHVHAHRDETTYLLSAAERGRPKRRRVKDGIPRLSELHFPVGGHRFRPCVEDVLQMVIEEFGVDARPEWRTAVREGRAAWRRVQISASVRDAPRSAAEVLEQLGWTLTPPDVAPADTLARLQAY